MKENIDIELALSFYCPTPIPLMQPLVLGSFNEFVSSLTDTLELSF